MKIGNRISSIYRVPSQQERVKSVPSKSTENPFHGETDFPPINTSAIQIYIPALNKIVTVFDATIPGIALHGVDKAAIHFPRGDDLIGQAFALPSKKDNAAWIESLLCRQCVKS